MFLVKVFLAKSEIHGIGLFAGENIEEGVLIYECNQSLDLTLSEKEFSFLNNVDKKFISHYGYLNKRTGLWTLEYDHLRFCNHSKDPNMIDDFNKDLIAKRDIAKGEELTQDYNFYEQLRSELK